MPKELETLFRILDENFIMYKRLNSGTHIKIWSDEKQKWINFYPSSGKVHWDGEKSTGRGINHLLSQLGIDFNTKESMECILIEGTIEKLSDNQFKISSGTKIHIPIGKPFSITPNQKIKIFGDFIEVIFSSDALLMSCNKIYFTENKPLNKEEVEI